MPLARIAILLIAALPACRGPERAQFAARDTVAVPSVVPIVDTTAPAPAERPPPDDCRYSDARHQTRIGEPGHGEPYDSAAMARGVEYRCALRPGGPEVRLMVLGEWGIPMAVDVHSPPEAARPSQRLFLPENDERAREGSTLVAGVDLNGDGWTDLRMPTFSGSGGVMYDVFLYAPAARAFVRDTVLSGGGNLRRIAGQPCVATSWRMGGGHWSSARYCWTAGRWILVQTVAQEAETARGERWIRTHRERRGDSLQLVRVDTLDDPNEDLSP